MDVYSIRALAKILQQANAVLVPMVDVPVAPIVAIK